MTPRCLLLGFFLLLPALPAEVVLAPYFRDHAVLQRDRPVPVWGRATPGETVVVTFSAQTLTTSANDAGEWRVDLAALPASATPAALVVRGNNTVTVDDVLVGDVWLLSGQSNMEWPVRESANAANEIAAATDLRIRHFRTERTIAHQPQSHAAGSWAVTSPETAGHFSAVGYFFAREIIRELNVPIGLLHSSWGGTPVESWLPPDALRRYPVRRLAMDHAALTATSTAERFGRHEAALAAWADQGAAPPAPIEPWAPGPEATPGVLYNGMVAPFVPAALRGVLWYQGEANADAPGSYAPLFAALIESWRAVLHQPELPFYWVQLANWDRGYAMGTNWAQLRDAQTATLRLPQTGQAITIEIGDPDDIHPRNKQDVGRRLARIALAQTYGRPIAFRGPSFAGLRREADTLVVGFDHAEGLTVPGEAVLGFEVAGVDRVFHPAQATINGSAVHVRAPAVASPVAVRYAWRNCPEANLYNGAGLPAVPFRSDDWPVKP